MRAGGGSLGHHHRQHASSPLICLRHSVPPRPAPFLPCSAPMLKWKHPALSLARTSSAGDACKVEGACLMAAAVYRRMRQSPYAETHPPLVCSPEAGKRRLRKKMAEAAQGPIHIDIMPSSGAAF